MKFLLYDEIDQKQPTDSTLMLLFIFLSNAFFFMTSEIRASEIRASEIRASEIKANKTVCCLSFVSCIYVCSLCIFSTNIVISSICSIFSDNGQEFIFKEFKF